MTAELYIIEVPRKYFRDKTQAQCRAEGVFASEKMMYETPDKFNGAVVLQFPGWKKELSWEVEGIQEFCKGFLWGYDTKEGQITAYHAQQVLKWMFDESEVSEPLFGKYQLIGTVFKVKRQQEVIGKGKNQQVFYLLPIEEVKKTIQEIEAEDPGDAETRYISMYAKAIHLANLCKGNTPYIHYHEVDGPFLARFTTQVRSGMQVTQLKKDFGGLVFYRTKEMCVEALPDPRFTPTQMGLGELVILLAETYLRGYPGIEVWVSPSEMYHL